MSQAFTKATFAYFAQAKRNRGRDEWLERNLEKHKSFVYEPFAHLVERMNQEFAKELPRIAFLPRRIARPKMRNPSEYGSIRSNAMVYFAEKASSQFESNPGIYLSMGADPEDNVFGVGLYMVSSRQRSILREAFVNDFDSLESILSNKRLKSRWGSLAGERYTRFPKGFDEKSPEALYIKMKNFYLAQDLKKTDICAPKFTDKVLRDVEAALPFLKWIIKTVGTYKPKMGQSRL